MCKQIIGDVQKFHRYSPTSTARYHILLKKKKEKEVESVIQKRNIKFGVAIDVRRKIDSTSKADAGQ